MLKKFAFVVGISLLGLTVSSAAAPGAETSVLAALKDRLPKTEITKVDCSKAQGLCEVTAGKNLFYTDRTGRMLIIGRMYDMETRQDLTASRLLELNPDMLVGGAASAQQADAAGAGEQDQLQVRASQRRDMPQPSATQRVSLAGLPQDGAIVWGSARGPAVTIFTDFRCSYCRALANALEAVNARVIERPISVMGSRELSNRVYCAKDQSKALRAAYAGEELPSATCDTSGLDANERFARAKGFTGTPVMVRSDGAVIEGYRPKEFLVTWLKGAKS